MDKRKRRLLCMLEGSGRKSRWISGAPPLSFKAQAAGTLENYRIYGNTVGGESVGDKTGNLFDEIYPEINDSVKYRAIYVGTGFFTLSSDIPIFSNTANLFLLNGNVSSGASSSVNGVGYGVPRSAESIDGYITIGYRNYYDVDPRDYNTMLNEGSTALPYEPYGYKVPVTVSNGTDTQTIPIYLPEQIRKVGDEAEYIDYGEQKQHRVRKNLLQNTAISRTVNGVTFTVNDDGSVTCNGTATDIARMNVSAEPSIFNDVILTGCPVGGDWVTFQFDILQATSPYSVLYRDVGSGVRVDTGNIEVYFRIRIASGYTCDNLTFYPMIRKADIEDDTYEPYIENTDLDVTLPALSTIKGTNVLSVGTEVQPSEIEVKGKIKAL